MHHFEGNTESKVIQKYCNNTNWPGTKTLNKGNAQIKDIEMNEKRNTSFIISGLLHEIKVMERISGQPKLNDLKRE